MEVKAGAVGGPQKGALGTLTEVKPGEFGGPKGGV